MADVIDLRQDKIKESRTSIEIEDSKRRGDCPRREYAEKVYLFCEVGKVSSFHSAVNGADKL
jgi:hypothetical protein